MPRSLNDLVSGRLMPGSEIWTPLGYLTALPQSAAAAGTFR